MALLAVANVIGAAILYIGFLRGAEDIRNSPFGTGTGGTKAFWGLGAVPLVAVVLSGIVMDRLYERRRIRLAAVQTGFFVLALVYAVIGVSDLFDFWF